MGAYLGHGVGPFVIVLSCRDGRKCFGLTRGKCQILKLIMPFYIRSSVQEEIASFKLQ